VSRASRGAPFAQQCKFAEQRRRDVDDIISIDLAHRVGAGQQSHFWHETAILGVETSILSDETAIFDGEVAIWGGEAANSAATAGERLANSKGHCAMPPLFVPRAVGATPAVPVTA